MKYEYSPDMTLDQMHTLVRDHMNEWNNEMDEITRLLSHAMEHCPIELSGAIQQQLEYMGGK